MFFQVIIVLKVHERSEHSAVIHMMAIDNGVCAGWIEGTSGIDKKHAADIIIAVKILSEIVFRVIRCIHDRIVNLGTLNRKPPDKILILLIQFTVLFHHCFGF